ncbi:MAG TPA: DNA-binding protein [Elusimicrobiota bacterium]|nr:DNA-binding protein [Elusimicrobiota bacterium]
MKYSEAKQGRVFVIRLEDGDILHEAVESFARQKGIRGAALIAVGGADAGSRLIVGPREGRAKPIVPMEIVLEDVYEITGTGTLFPDKNGKPVLHMHIAGGRKDQNRIGCVRRGVKVWHVMEIVLFELIENSARRMEDSQTGFELLNP